MNPVSGLPVYVVSSSGRQGTVRRRVVTEVIQKPFSLMIRAALCANTDIDFSGNGVVCGYNHALATAPPTGENGRLNSPSCAPFETGAGDLPGSWTTGTISNAGAAAQWGVPVPNAATN